MIQNPSVGGSGSVETVTITIDNSEYIPEDPIIYVTYVDNSDTLQNVERWNTEGKLVVEVPKNRIITAYAFAMGSTLPAILSGSYQNADQSSFFITGDCVITSPK